MGEKTVIDERLVIYKALRLIGELETCRYDIINNPDSMRMTIGEMR